MVVTDFDMWKRSATEIETIVAEACQELKSLETEIIEFRPRPGEWSVKEVVGHLVDSASNNHQRFVRLQVADGLFFPDYSRDNETWVSIQNYQEAAWDDLLSLWRYFNFHLAHLIRTVDEECLEHIWVVDEDTSIMFGELMIDYLRHLKDHMQQIRSLIDFSAQREML